MLEIFAMLFVIQLIIVFINITNMPKTIFGFIFQYTNFCTIFFTMICLGICLID